MRMRLLGFAMASLVCTGLSTLVGCGSDCGNGTIDNGEGQCVPVGLTCGDGTQLVSGVCQPNLTGCGRGTRLEGGVCIPDTATSACGNGTTYDTATGTCIANGSITCGENTTQQGNVCVGTGGGNAECGAGTVLENGVCVPDGTQCGTGTVLIDGVCQQGSLLQFVQNIPDAGVNVVDVYVGSERVVDDLAYRSASAFIGVPTGLGVLVRITRGDAADSSNPLASATIGTGVYAVVLNGNGAGSYAVRAVPAQSTGRNGSLALEFFNGAFNYPSFSAFINQLDLGSGNVNPEGTRLAFGQGTSQPVSLPSLTAAFDVFAGNSSAFRLASYQTSSGTALPVNTDRDASGAAMMIIASGIDGGAQDRQVGFFAVPTTGGAFLPLDRAARVQFINGGNLAHDVYVGDQLYFPNMSAMSGVRYLAIVSGTSVDVSLFADEPTQQTFGLALPGTGAIAAAQSTFAADQAYVVVLSDSGLAIRDGLEAVPNAANYYMVAFNATDEQLTIDANATNVGTGIDSNTFSTDFAVIPNNVASTITVRSSNPDITYGVALTNNVGVFVVTGDGTAGNTSGTVYLRNGDSVSLNSN